MLGLSLAYDIEPNMSPVIEIELVLGLTALAALVLLRTMIVRHRLHSTGLHDIPDELDLSDDLAADPELQQEIPERS